MITHFKSLCKSLKTVLASFGVLIALSVASNSIAQQATSNAKSLPNGDITVTLLGTGTPDPSPTRFSAATLVEAGGMKFLFDAGRGATIRLSQIKVPLGSPEAVLLTHLHSDHVVGLPDVWLTGFINPFFGGRRSALQVVGPSGTKNLVDHLARAYEADVAIRIADQRVPPETTGIAAREFIDSGVVFEKGGVKITAFEVDHGDKVKPTFGYRIDYKGRSVGISGDTKYDERLIKSLSGVDLLVHEVAEAPEAIKSMPWVKDIMDHHASASESGIVFSKTKPKLAAYTHLVLLSTPNHAKPTPAELLQKTRLPYDGPLVVGEDLTRFTVGEEVRSYVWDHTKEQYLPGPVGSR